MMQLLNVDGNGFFGIDPLSSFGGAESTMRQFEGGARGTAEGGTHAADAVR